MHDDSSIVKTYLPCIVFKQTFFKQDVIIPAGNIQIDKNGNGVCLCLINEHPHGKGALGICKHLFYL